MPASTSVAKRPPWRPWVAMATTPPASTFASIAGTTWGAAVAGLQRASGFVATEPEGLDTTQNDNWVQCDVNFLSKDNNSFFGKNSERLFRQFHEKLVEAYR